MKKILAIWLCLVLLSGSLAGCGTEGSPSATQPSDKQEATKGEAEPGSVDFSKTDGEMFTDRDKKTDFDEGEAVTVKLKGDTATASSDSVRVADGRVILTQEATYLISGSLSDGMLVVDAPEPAKLHLVLDGVEITSKTSAALYILEADKVVVTLAKGSENTLENGGEFVAIDDNNVDGAIFSKQDLTLNGTGTLTVTSPAGHGIVCKDDLVFTGGDYTVESASHGLDANDSVRVMAANLSIDAGKDAIHAENSDDASLGFVYLASGKITGEAEGDGISAGAYFQMQDGEIDLLVGGGNENGEKASSDYFGGFMGGGKGGRPDGMGGMGGGRGGMGGYAPTAAISSTSSDESSTSMKGIKAVSGLLIAGGDIKIDSADDAVHSDASLIIGGGNFTLASGDDAIHAEETLTVTAGKISISTSYEGLEALHVDVQGGEIQLTATDDGLNAAGGADQSGMTGGRDGAFGGGMGGGPGGMGGMGSGSNGSIKISGGTLYINSSGDGLDANGTLEISGGHTTVVGPTQGDTATLDYDKSGVITGGTFIGTGARNMAQSFSSAQQGVLAVSVGNQSAETEITVKDAKGETLLSYQPELSFAVLIFSSPDLVSGQTYTVTVGSESAEFQAS